MMDGVSLVTPGVVGWAIGSLLIAAGGMWLIVRFTGRDAHRNAVAETTPARGRARVPQGYWHPSMGPRPVEPVTQLLPRCADLPDATLLIPRQRAARRG